MKIVWSAALMALLVCPSGDASAAIAHSPDGTLMYVYAPMAFFADFPAEEYEAVGALIRDQDYNVTTAIYRDQALDNDPGACTMENFVSCRAADFLYVMTHGDLGCIDGIYMLDSMPVVNWIAGEEGMQARVSGVNPNLYSAYVPASWIASHWRPILDQTKAIVIYSVCLSHPGVIDSTVSASGGGVCFGYSGISTWGDADANNALLLGRMNGSLDGSWKRKAGEAFGGGAGYRAGFSMAGDPDITLCPAFQAKGPVGPTDRSGTGVFEVDTYCSDDVPAGEALTFQLAGDVRIENVRWVGSGKVNRIEFDWRGGCQFLVIATAHAGKFHSWGEITPTYHRMDGDRVTPNGDDYIWQFWHEEPATEVTLSSFTAAGDGQRIEIAWETKSEINTAGFNVLRRDREGATPVTINPQLIPARGGELQGARYSLIDSDVTGEVTYDYYLESVDLQGAGTMAGPVSCRIDSGQGMGIPRAFALWQNHPNPFNPNTTIRYDLPVDCVVNIEIFNALGRRVGALVSGFRKAGTGLCRWDGRDVTGAPVSSGVYFCRLRAGDFADVKKMILLR